MDSLYKINIYVPPLFEQQLFDSSATSKFFELAKATKGELKLLVNSALITREIVEIIRDHGTDNADLMILIDKTGSMVDDIENVKKGLGQIVEKLKEFKNVRLAIALYGDKNVDGPGWFSFRNFEQNYNEAKQFIKGITVTAGGDTPESVYEGFFESEKQNFWRSDSKRMIILIGDAPPLEKPLSEHSMEDVIKKATGSKIMMNFYPVVVTPSLGEPGMFVPEVKTYESKKIINALYPNPSFGPLNVNFENDATYSIEIFNSSGKIVLTEAFSGQEWKKDLSELNNGVYLLRATNANKDFEINKFIIQK